MMRIISIWSMPVQVACFQQHRRQSVGEVCILPYVPAVLSSLLSLPQVTKDKDHSAERLLLYELNLHYITSVLHENGLTLN